MTIAVDCVVATVGEDSVVRTQPDRVVARARPQVDLLNITDVGAVHQGVAAGCSRGVANEGEGSCLIGSDNPGGVTIIAAIDPVDPWSGNDEVVPGPALEDVVTVRAAQVVVPSPALKRVVEAAPLEVVIAGAAEHRELFEAVPTKGVGGVVEPARAGVDVKLRTPAVVVGNRMGPDGGRMQIHD